LDVRKLTFAGVLVIVLGLSIVGAHRAFALKADTSLQAVSEALTCQCGCGLTVANCNHPQCEFAVPMRTEIEAMISRGISRAAIIAHFRGKYGEKILSAPTTEGFNLLAWIMPFAALGVGGGLIFLAVGRWRSNLPGPTPSVLTGDSAFDSELKRRLERDLKEQS
jgi:cytochrome c-type biogenesis protein CcmH